jgi:phosphatidylinositol alpha-1,6-mannosyltransferase
VRRKIVEDYGVPQDRVHAIQAFCSAYTRTAPGALPEAAAAFAAAHRPLVVSYVFFFHPEFTPDLMVMALERLRAKHPEAGLVVMGDRKYSEDTVAVVEKLGLDGHVLLTGALPRDQFLAVLQRGDLYLRTPLGDGVASSVLEAFSLGVPVVASDNGTRPESCVLYRPGELEDMVEKIEGVLADREAAVRRIASPEEADNLHEEVDLLLSV